jgi:hypothetical protein
VRDGVAQAGERAVAVDRPGQLGAAGEEDLVGEPVAERERARLLQRVAVQRRIGPVRVGHEHARIALHERDRGRHPVQRRAQAHLGVPVQQPLRARQARRHERPVGEVGDGAEVLAGQPRAGERVVEVVLDEEDRVEPARGDERVRPGLGVGAVQDVVDERRPAGDGRDVVGLRRGEALRGEHLAVGALVAVDEQVDGVAHDASTSR